MVCRREAGRSSLAFLGVLFEGATVEEAGAYYAFGLMDAAEAEEVKP